MIRYLLTLCLLSVIFWYLWQYTASPWLIFGYLLASVLPVLFLLRSEKRKQKQTLARLEAMISGDYGTYLTDEGLSPTEHRLMTRLCDLEAREARIQDSYRNISSLVSDIAHQSKTPLSAILMTTELMGDDFGGILQKQILKLQFLMESLTKLAKCEGGLIAENLKPKENTVHELLCHALEASYPVADKKNIAIQCCIPDGLKAFFDLRWTAEAVGNLLDNAVKYSPDGSTIRISAQAYDLYVRIDIADEGMGIEEEELCHIWKRFYRGKNSLSEQGVGIGLYLCANILRAQGGRVSVKSDEHGSVFSVFLSKL